MERGDIVKAQAVRPRNGKDFQLVTGKWMPSVGRNQIGWVLTKEKEYFMVYNSTVEVIIPQGEEPVKDEQPRAKFDGGGVRDGSPKTERFELTWTLDDPYEDQMLTRYAAWMARGAEKYADRNWESFKGEDALEHAKGSLLRHVFKFLAGMEDEDHAAAVWFNVHAIDRVRRRMKNEG